MTDVDGKILAGVIEDLDVGELIERAVAGDRSAGQALADKYTKLGVPITYDPVTNGLVMSPEVAKAVLAVFAEEKRSALD